MDVLSKCFKKILIQIETKHSNWDNVDPCSKIGWYKSMDGRLPPLDKTF